MRFHDKVVVVTGSSSGIGSAIVHQLRVEGARVVGADITPSEPVSQMSGKQWRFVPTDVGREDSMIALIESVRLQEGEIDLFVSNAGVHMNMDVMAQEPHWQRIIAVNQMSHIWAARHVLPAMLERGHGRFLITASASSFLSEIFSIGYATTKYAAFGLGEWLAFSYKSSGLQISVACPGPVWSPMMQEVRYMRGSAISAELAAAKILDGVAEGRFLITTHEESAGKFRQKIHDPDAYVAFLSNFRVQAIELQGIPDEPTDA
jgi:NAD(P)-dependent dehydrogenase (short-subunit alcohol dehydrogenase family)